LCGRDRDGQIGAYARLMPPGVKADAPMIGRVVVRQQLRATGLGRTLMQEALRRCTEQYPQSPVLLSGQQHLERFYASLGFATIGEPYMEDGIWHVDMRREAILGA
jgi:ElaA protein